MRESFFSFLLVSLLSIVYSWYSGQNILGIVFLLIYIAGLLTVRLSIGIRICFQVYNVFFAIYGVLLLVTQYIFIDDIPFGYFNHIDASNSFYEFATLEVGATSWDTLVQSTMLSATFADYPLFSFWINAWKLVGYDISVDSVNLRFFLRFQNLIFASGILVIMAKYFQERGITDRQNFKYCLLFGLFSYLFLTSVVYSRDLHIALFYTLGGYYCLSTYHHRLIYLKLSVIALICFGLRPENGMFALSFILYYVYKDTPPSMKLFLAGCMVFIIAISAGLLDVFLEAVAGFQEHTSSTNVGGLYEKLNSFPFPINVLFNTFYSIIMPFPLTMYVMDVHIGLFGFFSIGMPVISIVSLWGIFSFMKKYNRCYSVSYFFIILIAYMIMCCSIEPNVRRTFAVLPSLFMLFISVKPFISKVRLNNIIKCTVIFIAVLNLPAVAYLLLTGKLF